jgi:UDP-2,3-diacylglucosamine pyrophosphatase LpxH
MQSHIFLSDVHLGAFDDKTNEKIENDLLSLIEYCSENKIRISILGDLFDYWMEYPGKVPKLGEKVLNTLSDFNRSVEPILYITGNHDNWTRDFFEKLGFDMESDFRIVSISDKKILLHHGDGFNDENLGLPRPLFHRILRNKTFVNVYQKVLPFRAGIGLMKFFSNMNRRFSKPDKTSLDNWSETVLKNNDIHMVLCGHDHLPRTETFDFGTYINLGTFFHHRSLVLYTENQFQLVTWSGTTKTFTPFN